MNYVIAVRLNVQGTTSNSHETLTNNAISLLILFQSLKVGLQMHERNEFLTSDPDGIGLGTFRLVSSF